MAERITLVAPDGSIGTVPAEQAQAALEQGYRQPNQEERQLEAAGESPLRAGLEGLARGVIPGIDQAFINAGVNPKALQLREKANPWASGIGEFGGNVIQTLAVPEVSAEAGASKAAQFGASLVKPAVETGLMGLGQVVSESTLENRPLLGEDMASGFMKNALLGAGIGAGFKGVGAAARFARSKLLQAGVKGMPVEQILEASAPEAERILLTPEMRVKPVALTPEMEQGAFQRADTLVDETVASPGRSARSSTPEPFFGPTEVFDTPEKIQAEFDRFNRMREAGFKTVEEFKAAEGGTVNMRALKSAEALPKEQLDEAWKAYQSARAETIPEMGAPTEAAAEKALKEPQNWFGQMADLLAFRQLAMKGDLKRWGLFARWKDVIRYGKENGIVSWKSDFNSVNKLADEAAAKEASTLEKLMSNADGYDPNRGVQAIEDKLLKDLDTVAANGPAVEGVRKRLAAFLEKNQNDFTNAFREQEAWGHIIGPVDATQDLLFKARGIMRDDIAAQLAERSGGESSAALKKAWKDLASASALKDLSNRRLMGELGNRGFGMSDFFGANLGAISGGSLGGIAGGIGAHVLKDRGGFVASGALDMLSNSRFAKNAAKGLGQLLEKQLNAVPELFGKLEPGLRIALAKGGNALLQEHARIMRTHQGPEYLALLGLQDEDAKARHEFAARAHVVGQLEEHTENLQAALQAPFKDIGAFKNPTHAPLTKKQFVKQMGELKALMMDPSQLSQHLPTDASLFPEISAVSIATAQNAAKYLISKAPKDPNDGMPPAYRTPWEPSRADLAEWSNYVHAVADPVGCLARALRGDNVKCTMDVLKTVYPDMLSEMQAQAIQRLSQASKPLTFKQRLALSPVLGSQVFNMPPQVQTLMQGMLSPQQPEQGKGGGGRSPSDGRQKVDVEKNLQTQAQRTEAR